MKVFKYTDWHQNLNQIGQQLNTEFSLAHKQEDGSYTNTMPWVKCRAYFGDLLEAVQTQTTQGIYGFKFDPKKQPFDTDKCGLLIKFETPESYEAYQNNYNHFKKELKTLTGGIGYGTIHKTTDPLVMLVLANKLWQQAVINISWFTYVHKCLSYPNLDYTKSFYDNMCNHKFLTKDWVGVEKLQTTNEAGYINGTDVKLKVYLKHIKTLTSNLKYVHGWPDPKDIHIVHNSSGFSSILKNLWGTIGEQINAKLAQQPTG